MPEAETPAALPEQSLPQKEGLSDKQMGGFLSAIGNNEAKAFLLLQMEPHTIYTASELHQLMMSGQGQHPGWRMNSSGPFDYCKDSLAPIGLVAQEVLTAGDLQTIGYIKTDYGQNEGSILAGLLLDYSKTHPDVSLSQLFSVTTSSSKSEDPQNKKRAPMTRMKIFWELVTASLPLREYDLLNAIHETHNLVENHLWQLNRTGIIDYKSIALGEPVSFYKLSPNHPLEKPPQYRNIPGLTTFVYQALIDNPDKEWTLAELAQLYLQTKNENQQSIYYKFLKPKISRVCSYLKKNGYAQQGEFSFNKQTIINLSSPQRQNLLDLVTLMDAFQRQDPHILERGRKMAQYFRDHPEEVASLMTKAREKSSNTNKQSQEETAALINNILTSQPGLTHKELQSILTQIGRNLSTHSIREVTARFHIPFTLEKGVKHFSPHPNPPNKYPTPDVEM